MKTIPFFCDSIRLDVDEATRAADLGPHSLAELADGNPCGLYELDGGRLELRVVDPVTWRPVRFASGVEI